MTVTCRLNATYRTTDELTCEGFISMDEFEEACRLLGQHTASVIPREHVIAMARNMDLNKDGLASIISTTRRTSNETVLRGTMFSCLTLNTERLFQDNVLSTRRLSTRTGVNCWSRRTSDETSAWWRRVRF